MKKIAGIYKIVRIGTDQCYVGSSSNITKRWEGHRLELNKGAHHAAYLQRSWTKHGVAAFEFVVLENCEGVGDALKALLQVREQHWMDTLKPRFNTLKAAYSTLGFKHSPEVVEQMRLRTHSQETREKLRLAQTGVKRSAESVDKSRQAHIGRVKLPSEIEKTIKTRMASGGYSPSTETKEKISKTLTGTKLSPERLAAHKPFAGKKHTLESRAKMSARVRTPEEIEKSRLARIGWKATPERIEEMRQARLGKLATEETKEKIRQAVLGRRHTEEAKENMRKPKSPEHAAKIKLAQVGRTHTPETKEKMRLAALARRERERLEREQSTPS